MHRHPEYTRTRLAQFAERLGKLIYAQRKPVERLLISDKVDRISYAAAQELAYRPALMGAVLGPPWATFWFKVEAEVPSDWRGRRVDLLWNSHSEATLWVNGRTIQGLNFHTGDRPDAVLLPEARGGESLRFQIEMACNGKFGITGDPSTWKVGHYVLEQCDIAAYDPVAWELYHDFLVLQELELAIHKNGGFNDRTWGGFLLSELNRFVNVIDADDRKTWPDAQAILKKLYQYRNASMVQELSAIGHAHIDTAWLWPLAETNRKCERTFSTQTAYMEAYPDYKFACSQAYQYQIIKDRNPDLYDRMRAAVKRGQFVPVGGTWIEPDCNIPSGESLARQFLYGQRFFEAEFGARCAEFWNPDVFGYNGQLPQLMKLSGIKWFLTQKLSWNQFNRPWHQTFIWEGIDGSEVLAHFPPSDTYNATANVFDLARSAGDYKDNDRSRHSLLVFGYGDGGGGPTKTMIETLRRAKDLQCLPRVTMRTSREFFELLEKDYTDHARQIGELYFEYHRGTYTTQAAVKKSNRKSEFLLHDVEFLSTITRSDIQYPRREIDLLWQILLLNQFHDILPGSSIALVYQDSAKDFERLKSEGERLRAAALGGIVHSSSDPNDVAPVNTIGFSRSEVAERTDGTLMYVTAPSYGIGRASKDCPDKVSIAQTSGGFVLENAHLRAELSADGTVRSLVEKPTGREALTGPANQFVIYRDEPIAHDAWDIDPQTLETEQTCGAAHSAKVTESGGLRAAVSFERKIGQKSSAQQTVSLSADAHRLEFHTEVDWHEDHKLLKVAFPVNVRAMNATYEMQFGCVERPTHYNTSFDLARFEVPGHKWVDLSEPGFGVALLSESKYGYSTFGNVMRMTLLRSTKRPDPDADQGRHEFSYALMPHSGSWQEAGVVAEAYRFNVPVMLCNGTASPQSWASVDHANLVLDTIKRAQENDDVIIRLYEAHGARGEARVQANLPFRRAVLCNLLEDESDAAVVSGQEIRVPYRPFQIITLKLKRE
jgi:alpha-mannosidase